MRTVTKAGVGLALWVSAAGLIQAQAFMNDYLPSAPRLKASPVTAAPGCQCADLGGVWSGACSVNGQAAAPVQALTIIQTSCERVTINGEAMPIGGQKTGTLTLAPVLCESVQTKRSASNRASTAATQTGADWSADKTGLDLTITQNSRNIAGDAALTQVTGSLRREDAHLLLDMKSVNSANQTQTVSCSFEK